jgi:hypothetical protein
MEFEHRESSNYALLINNKNVIFDNEYANMRIIK